MINLHKDLRYPEGMAAYQVREQEVSLHEGQ